MHTNQHHNLTPLDYLLSVMRDESASAHRRAEAAAAVLDYAEPVDRRTALQIIHHANTATALGELEVARQVAKERGDAQAMVTATMGKARIAGLIP